MVEQVKITRGLFAKVALVVIAMFAVGITFGFIIDSLRTGFLNEEIIAANIETESFVISQAYLANNPDYCKLTEGYIGDLSENVEQLGKDIAEFGNKLVFINSTFLGRKYFLYEIRLWMMLEDYKKRCNQTISTVLFFYNDDDETSYVQGLALTAMKEKLQDKVMIFSFKHGFQEPSLKLIETSYNVVTAPSIVINGKLYTGLVDKAKLETILSS